MAMLEPRLRILDETDSGLDIDALRTVADGVNALRDPTRAHPRHHPLPAPARLHRARPRARAGLRPRSERSGGKELALRAGGRRLCRRARRRVRRAAGGGLRPWPRPARAIEPVPAFAAVFANVAEPAARRRDLRGLAARVPSTASWRWASRPAGPRTGSTPTSSRRRTCRWPWRPRAEIGLDAIAPYLLGGHKARRLIFVNGHVVPELSHVQSLPAGVRIMSLPRALQTEPERVADALGGLQRRAVVHRAQRRLRRCRRLDRARRRCRRRGAAAAAVPDRGPAGGVHEPSARSSCGWAPARGCG